MNFEDATYVAPKGGPGKTADPNPYTDVIKLIALKQDDKGKPIAKKFTISHAATPDARKQAVNKAKRQLSNAGKGNYPAVTVPSVEVPVKLPIKGKKFDENDPTTYTESDSQTQVTFWTVPRQVRTRKPVAPVKTGPVG
jgi:hypothetical protein